MIPNHKGEIPVVLLLLPFLLGIVMGFYLFAGANVEWLIGAFIFFCLVFIVLNLTYSRFGLFKRRWLGGAVVVVILFLSGWILVINHSELHLNNHFSKSKAQYLVVKITNEPVLKNGLLRFTAAVDESVIDGKKFATGGTLLVTIKDSAAKKLYYGDELLIPASYKPIEPPFNPAEFNYKKYLADRNIFYQAFLYPKQYVLLQSNMGNPIIAGALRLRRQLVEKLKRNMRDTNAVAVASTLILGYKADLSTDTLQAYSKTGTVYVLSVSGAQVAILFALLSFALSFLEHYRHGKLFRAVIIIAIIWYYSMLTGFSIAVCRAALMVSMVIIGKSFSRYINTLNILAVSAFILLLYDPFYISEVGFQLSYLAVFGILILQPIIYGWLNVKNTWVGKLWALCSLSIAAQVITFPLCAIYFHQFPVYFLISNLLVIIPAALIMYTGVIYLLLPQIPVVSASLGFVIEKTIVLMNKGLAFMETAPFASISKLWISTPEYLLLYGVIISLFYFLYNKKLWALQLCLYCGLLLAVSFSIKSIDQSRSKNIAWLNLGKHQGIVFKNGNEAVVLSDLKNTDKAYLYSIQPYLDSCQINDVKLFNLNKDINITWLQKKYGYIRVFDGGIFIFNSGLQKGALPQKLTADYVYLTGNPDSEINSINSNFVYNSLFIDGTNSDASINKWEKQLSANHVNYVILKRNKSVISVSKNNKAEH